MCTNRNHARGRAALAPVQEQELERGGGRGGVPTRKRSMTRWSGRWERSAMWAMRRSAESRVRESSEGGRIGPDLDLARLFIATLSWKQRCVPLAAVPRHVAALDPRPPRAPLPTPASCCCVCRQGRAASVGGRAEPKAREAEEATTVTRAPIGDFSRRFLRTPLVFPRFSAFPLAVRFA